MSGFQTLVKFACLSDESRWFANRFDFESWLPELDEHDRELIRLLDCIRDGEYSGQASAAQFWDMFIKARNDGTIPKDLIDDWGSIFTYMYTIVYEEWRHGVTLGSLYHYVTTGRTDYIAQVDVKDFMERYVWCYEERRYWNVYSYILSHLFSEIINTELYRDITNRVHHPILKETAGNIRNDEARHIAAWTALIKDLIDADPRHKQLALESLDRGLLYHNGMVHETYFEGLNKMLPLFMSEQFGTNKLPPLKRIIRQKARILHELFGDDCPYTENDIQKMHLEYLQQASGRSRAKYTDDLPSNIEFVA